MFRRQKSQNLPVLSVGEADGPVIALQRAVELSPGGVIDLVEALRRGMPVFAADGVYLVPVAQMLEAASLRQIAMESTE